MIERPLAGLCAALLDLDPADARQLAVGVTNLIAQMPRPARTAIASGVVATEALSLATTGRRLDRLDNAEREALLAHWARWRPAVELVEALKIPIVLVRGASEATAELTRRAQSRPARPDAELNMVTSTGWPSRAVVDAIVVGSGAGGAMAVRSLARAGLDTVVIEEGRRFGVEEFRSRPALDRFTDLYRDAGTTIMAGRPPVLLPLGRGVGGTTLVNSGTCYRTPGRVLRRWHQDRGLSLADPARFGPLLDDVEATLQVAPVPLDVMGRNGRLAMQGAQRLGWSHHPLVRNAPGCGGCCQCAIGCPRNAKFGVHLNALPQACAAGARIVSDARVLRVLHGAGRVTGILGRRPDGSTFEILAPRVIVAAGATETPPLLRRSGLGRHPHLGRNLSVHPAVSVAGRFEETVDATNGVLQSAGIDEFHESDGILLEATSTPPGMGSMVPPGTGRALAGQLDTAAHLATVGAMIADQPSGRVLGARRSLIYYPLARHDGDRLVRAIGHAGRLLFAAGATEVLTGIAGHERVRTPDELDTALTEAEVRRLHVAAFHPTGTARMGADAQTCPVDERGQLRGVDGLWVADAAAVPSCPEVNPQMTIMALAQGVAAAIPEVRG